jgi:N-acetylglucosamine-6-phosphate deacetylase
MPPGRYRFGSDDDGSFFESDGTVGFVPGNGLASSVVGMDHMMRHMKQNTSATLPQAVRMASLTPAERTGIAKTCGSLEKGKQADVLVLNRRLEVQRTIISGVEVPRD